METVRESLRRRIRVLRERKGLTQERLAEQAGLSGKFVGEIERGMGNPTIETLERIARALGVPISDLLVEREEDRVLADLSKRDLAALRRTMQVLGRILGPVS